MDSMSFLYSSCPKTDITEFFPDDDEEEAEGAAPAVDASGQYAFQSDGTFSAFNLLQMTNEQLPLLRVVSTLVDSNHLRSIILGYTRNRPLYPVSFSSTSISRIILKTQNKGQQSRMVIWSLPSSSALVMICRRTHHHYRFQSISLFCHISTRLDSTHSIPLSTAYIRYDTIRYDSIRYRPFDPACAGYSRTNSNSNSNFISSHLFSFSVHFINFVGYLGLGRLLSYPGVLSGLVRLWGSRVGWFGIDSLDQYLSSL